MSRTGVSLVFLVTLTSLSGALIFVNGERSRLVDRYERATAFVTDAAVASELEFAPLPRPLRSSLPLALDSESGLYAIWLLDADRCRGCSEQADAWATLGRYDTVPRFILDLSFEHSATGPGLAKEISSKTASTVLAVTEPDSPRAVSVKLLVEFPSGRVVIAHSDLAWTACRTTFEEKVTDILST